MKAYIDGARKVRKLAITYFYGAAEFVNDINLLPRIKLSSLQNYIPFTTIYTFTFYIILLLLLIKTERQSKIV